MRFQVIQKHEWKTKLSVQDKGFGYISILFIIQPLRSKLAIKWRHIVQQWQPVANLSECLRWEYCMWMSHIGGYADCTNQNRQRHHKANTRCHSRANWQPTAAENVPWSDNCLKLLQGIYKSPVYEKATFCEELLTSIINPVSLGHLLQIQSGLRLEKPAMI
mgnify:CR=1 FL=1